MNFFLVILIRTVLEEEWGVKIRLEWLKTQGREGIGNSGCRQVS